MVGRSCHSWSIYLKEPLSLRMWDHVHSGYGILRDDNLILRSPWSRNIQFLCFLMSLSSSMTGFDFIVDLCLRCKFCSCPISFDNLDCHFHKVLLYTSDHIPVSTNLVPEVCLPFRESKDTPLVRQNGHNAFNTGIFHIDTSLLY